MVVLGWVGDIWDFQLVDIKADEGIAKKDDFFNNWLLLHQKTNDSQIMTTSLLLQAVDKLVK